MRNVILGAAVGAGLAVVVLGGIPDAKHAFAQRSSPLVTGDLIALAMPMTDGRQLLTIVDPKLRVVSVYHVEPSGGITLKSVRNVNWDLQMEAFNSAAPLPQEIRAQLEQR
jgi:hypothetical protein